MGVAGLMNLYASLEAEVNRVLSTTSVSCTKGCTHCCYMLTAISSLEGDLIAEYLLKSRRDMIKVAHRLERSAQVMSKAKKYRNYFLERRPCALLDEKNKECTIYEVRPSPCRYHYATTPVMNCSIKSTEDVTTPNLTKLEAVVFKFCMEHGKDIAGPLPLLVLDSLERAANCRSITHIRNRLPTLEQWLSHVFDTGFLTFGSADEVRAIRRSYEEVLKWVDYF